MLTINIFIVKLVNLLFSVCIATGYIHSGEIKIFKTAERIEMPFGAWTLGPRNHVLGARISLPDKRGTLGVTLGHTQTLFAEEKSVAASGYQNCSKLLQNDIE